VEVKRDLLLQKLVNRKHNGMIKVVTGMRRSGKSYLLFNLFVDHLHACGVTDDHIVKVNLEDRKNKKLRDPDLLLEFIDGKITDQGLYYILLDEVQLVPEFEDVLNSFLHVRNADVYVTGSNSRFLSTDVITEFRGRGDEVRVRPLSFSEYWSVQEGKSLERALTEYMTYGGLPQLVEMPTDEQKEEYLKGLFKETYLKDIKERYKIRNEDDLEELVDVMASCVGGLTNPTKLRDTFRTVKRSSIAFETIRDYLKMMQEAFLLEKAVRYDIKGRRYIDTPCKYYFEDCGLRNARLNFRQVEETHLMENVIYNELRRRGFSVDVGEVVVNWKDEMGKSKRSSLEVDFVVNKGSQRYYIQSAYALPTPEKVEQENRSLMNIDDSFRKIVIVKEDILLRRNDAGIVTMGLREFLMDESSLDK